MTKQEFLNIACGHYNDQLKKIKITSLQTTEYEVNSDSFKAALNDIRERLKVRLKSNGVCSDILINQLARHAASLGEIFDNSNKNEDFKFVEFYNALEILDRIELLENNKVNGEQFKRLPLKGLYKMHHGSHSGRGYSLMRNIKNYWFNDKNELIPKRTNEFDKIIQETGLNSIQTLMNKMHDRVYSKELTGEWIVYALHGKIKYYLCLALHDEGDENIFENKIKVCYKQFPELAS